MKKTSLTIFAAIILGIAVMATAKDRYQDLQLFAKVLNLVQKYYVEEVDTKRLIYGGIKGMLQELDPHTNFLQPEIYKEFESETSGQFGGLGIEITVREEILTVISPIEDTPAWKAGIKAGDKIVSINGVSTKGMSLVEAAKHMRGRRGSKVILGIFREGFEKPKDFAVVRGTVKIKSVKYTDLEEGYGYVKITHFIENTAKDLKKALAAHKKKHKGMKGLIIDLRKNPGGLLDQAVKISDLFLEEGKIVSTMDRSKNDPEVLSASKDGTLSKFPLIVLIDEYSASASEIVAGALQDNKRALIMGQRSFGKGSVQSVVKLGDGSGLKLTVARYYTPSGRSIQAEGIAPDVTVDNLDQSVLNSAKVKIDVKRERDIKGHLEGDKEKKEKDRRSSDTGLLSFWWASDDEPKQKTKSPKTLLLEKDFQAQQAYNYLKAWSVMDTFDQVPEKLKR
jgi:carboxyl-terminal processing protease